MSDARFRAIERLWSRDPTPHNSFNYIKELARIGREIELSLVTAPLAQRYREQLKSTIKPVFPHQIMFLNRPMVAILEEIMVAYSDPYPVSQISPAVIELTVQKYQDQSSRMAYLRRQAALIRALEVAIPNINLNLADKLEFELVSLFWVPSGTPHNSGALSTALRESITNQSLFFAVIRATTPIEIGDDLREITETIRTYRYYTLYYFQSLDTGIPWVALPDSGYINVFPPTYENIYIRHNNSIVELYGDLDAQHEEASDAYQDVVDAEQEVEDYRRSVARTIDQTYLSVWGERDRANITLYDRFTEDPIVSWWDEDVYQLFEDGFIEGPFEATPGGLLHRTVFVYAEELGLLPWQQPPPPPHLLP